MATTYNGLQFRTQLEAQWAAFFDLAKWDWRVNPAPVGDWAPDFRVTFPCNHSECSGSHTLLVAILPLAHQEDLKGHPSLLHIYGIHQAYNEEYRLHGVSIDAGAIFGASPRASTWVMSHGSGGGVESVVDWVNHPDSLWTQAARLLK